MSERDPIAPFELDPRHLDPARIELVEEPEPAPPALVALEPAPAVRRLWLRLLGAGAGLFLLGALGLEIYDYLAGLFERSLLLGGGLALLLAAALAGAFGVAASEIRSLRRLARIDGLRAEAAHLLGSEVHGRAEALLERVAEVYRERQDVREAVEHFRRQASDALDDGERLRLFAATVLAPLDRRAYGLVKAGARDIGALTAFSPFGLLDGLIVLARTLHMLRQIATLYGVRPTAAATLSLLRRALRNVLIAGVGEIASDAAVETAGASLLSVLSARAGQGAVNGLLAARLGLTAMQLCRPLPFAERELPSFRQLRSELFG